MPWDRNTEENEVLSLYKRFISIRKSSDVFSKGDFDFVYAIDRVIGFLRSMGDEKYIVLSNFGENGERIRVDLGKYKIFKLDNQVSENGVFYIDLEPFGVKIMRA